MLSERCPSQFTLMPLEDTVGNAFTIFVQPMIFSAVFDYQTFVCACEFFPLPAQVLRCPGQVSLCFANLRAASFFLLGMQVCCSQVDLCTCFFFFVHHHSHVVLGPARRARFFFLPLPPPRHAATTKTHLNLNLEYSVLYNMRASLEHPVLYIIIIIRRPAMFSAAKHNKTKTCLKPV